MGDSKTLEELELYERLKKPAKSFGIGEKKGDVSNLSMFI